MTGNARWGGSETHFREETRSVWGWEQEPSKVSGSQEEGVPEQRHSRRLGGLFCQSGYSDFYQEKEVR